MLPLGADLNFMIEYGLAVFPWWCHQMEAFSTLLALCEGNTTHGCFPLANGTDLELWCFLWSAPELMVKQTIEMLVIWDAIRLIMPLLINMYALPTQWKHRMHALQWHHMSVTASQITGNLIVWSIAYSGWQQKKIKDLHYCPLWRESTDGFSSQRPLMWKHLHAMKSSCSDCN